MSKLAKTFPFLFISALFINSCVAQGLSLRQQADNFCNAHNSRVLTKEETDQVKKIGLDEVISLRVHKAYKQPDLKIILDEVFNSKSNDSMYYDRLNKALSEKTGKAWSCPYLTYTFESESLASDLKNNTDAKLLPIKIGNLEPYSKLEANELIISIDGKNEIYADELKLASTDIENIISVIKKMGASKNTRIIINADANSSWQTMLSVIFAIKESGVDTTYFVTQ